MSRGLNCLGSQEGFLEEAAFKVTLKAGEWRMIRGKNEGNVPVPSPRGDDILESSVASVSTGEY